VPVGHAWQLLIVVLPVTVEYEPAAHCWHVVDAEAMLNEPAAQLVHVALDDAPVAVE